MEALRREKTMAKAAASIGISRARAYRLVSARKGEPGDDE
jgi:hypothetical protein